MNTLKDELQKRAYIKPDSKYLNQIEQYIISLLIAGFIYGGIYFSIFHLIDLFDKYFNLSTETLIIIKEIKDLLLLDKKLKYLIPIFLFLFLFGLAVQSINVLTSQRDDE